MFRSGDLVEEIATGRRGTVAESGIVGGPVSRLTVQFQDGKQPLIEDIEDPSQWRLVKRPGADDPPRLLPKTWVV